MPAVVRIHQFHQVVVVCGRERLQSAVVNNDEHHMSEALDDLLVRTGETLVWLNCDSNDGSRSCAHRD